MLVWPLYSFSQTWNKEEQAFLDHFKKVWEQLNDKPINWEHWKSTVNPDENLIWWWTNEGVPKDLNANKNALLNFAKEGQITNNSHIRPIRISIVGDVAMIWLYGYFSWSDNKGQVYNSEDKRLEIFKRDGSGWKFLGGMVDVVNPQK